MAALATLLLAPLFLSQSASAAESSPHSWLSQLNFYRRMANLPEVTENQTLSAAAKNHSLYLVKYGYDKNAHEENTPGYTSNVHRSGYTPDFQADPIDSWMEGPFHALWMLNPALKQVGFGTASDSSGDVRYVATLDVLSSPGSVPSSVEYPIFFPRDGAYMPLWSQSGESPDPGASCGYTGATGPAIMVQFEKTPKVTAHSFKQNGVEKPHCVFTGETYKNPKDAYGESAGRNILNNHDAVVILPKEQLSQGSDYRVSVTVNGKTYSWSFTTNPVKPPGQNLVWKWSVGLYGVWHMNGIQHQSSAWIGYEPDLNWKNELTADFDNNGSTDILQRHVTTGVVRVAVFDGPYFQRFVVLDQALPDRIICKNHEYQGQVYQICGLDPNWSIVGTGDFNRDGRVDILWRNKVTGANTIGLMDGFKWWKSAPISGSHPKWGWDIVATGDVDGDYLIDILWRNPNHGQNAVWYMSWEKWHGWADFDWLPTAPVGWELPATGDFNDDGKLDLLFRNPNTGENLVAYMDKGVWKGWGWLPPGAPGFKLLGTGDFE